MPGRPKKTPPADPKTLVFGSNGSTIIIAKNAAAFRKAKNSTRMKKVDSTLARRAIGSPTFNVAMANAALPWISVQKIPISG